MQRSNGFTLIEILIALFIFAIIGILCARSLQGLIHTRDHLKKTDDNTLQLMTTMTLMRRDFANAIDRGVLDEKENSLPALIASRDAITFTRSGIINPSGQIQSSNLQRIKYELLGDQLVRVTYAALDMTEKTEQTQEVLLHHVTSMQWQCIASNGEAYDEWPIKPKPGTTTPPAVDVMPKAILMVAHIQGQGVLQGVFPIPSRGVDEAALNHF